MVKGFTHNVQDGESAESVAATYGVPLKKVWSDGQNQALNKARDDDPHILSPNDNLFVPFEAKEMSKATDKSHMFVVSRPKTKLKVQLMRHGWPMSTQQFVLKVDGSEVLSGPLGFDGIVEAEIPVLAQTATLTVEKTKAEIDEECESDPTHKPATHKTYQLTLRGIHPMTETTGWQARIANLGYPVGAVDGKAGRLSQASICLFQDDRHAGLKLGTTPTADSPDALDSLTCSHLKKAHGC